MLLAVFRKKNVFRDNWIQKIMIQFCHLILYLGIETVSCRLLLRMGKDEHAQLFQVFNTTCPRKLSKNNYCWYSVLKFVWYLLQNLTQNFVYGKRHQVMTSSQNWPKTAISWWHPGPFKPVLSEPVLRAGRTSISGHLSKSSNSFLLVTAKSASFKVYHQLFHCLNFRWVTMV